MELDQFRPYGFTRMSEVFDLCMSHFKLIIIRADFDKCEYFHKNIQWNWRRLRWLGLMFLVNLFSVVQLLALTLAIPGTEEIKRFFENHLQVKRIEIFSLLLAFTLVCVEYICLSTFVKVLQYRFQIVNLLDDYLRSIRSKLNRVDRVSLVHFFNRITFFSGILYKLCFGGLVVSYSHTMIACVRRQNLFEIPFTVSLFTPLKLSIDFALAMLFIMVTHVFNFVRIFRVRMAHSVRYLKLAKAQPQSAFTFFTRFQRDYVNLFGEIALYNDTIQHHWLAMDFMLKVSCTLFLTFCTKQNHLSLFSKFFILLFAQLIFYFEAMYALFAYFPGQNLVCYKKLCSWSVQSHHYRHHHPRLTKNILQMFQTTKQVVKRNHFVQSVSDNQLGFTMGNLYLITKFKFLEMILINLGFMSLFYKYIRV